MVRAASAKLTKYAEVLQEVFFANYSEGATRVWFERDDIDSAIDRLHMQISNPADVVYNFRYRLSLPPAVAAKAPPGRQWIIWGMGKGMYEFAAVRLVTVEPNRALIPESMDDATPRIVKAFGLTETQLLLSRVRHNGLVGKFLGITAHSLETHWRTSVEGWGQIEIDEIYAGAGPTGEQFLVPIQARGQAERIAVVQARQDILKCEQDYPTAMSRAVAVKALPHGVLALFEMRWDPGAHEILVAREQHYRLVASDRRA